MTGARGAVSTEDRRAPDKTLKAARDRDAHRSGASRTILVRSFQVAIIVVLIGLWQYMGSGSKTLLLTVSTPSAIARWVWSWATNGTLSHGNGWSDLVATAKTAALGYVFGAGSGVVIGSIVGGSRWLHRFGAPFVAMLNAFPKIALAPLFVVVFGASLSMQVYFVSAGVFFITFFAMFHGLQSIDMHYLRNAKMLGANLFWRTRVVYLPSTVGWLMSALRLTATWSIASTVVVEYLTSGPGGMGVVVNAGQASDNVPQAIGGIVIISAFALIVDRLLVRLNRRVTRWRTS